MEAKFDDSRVQNTVKLQGGRFILNHIGNNQLYYIQQQTSLRNCWFNNRGMYNTYIYMYRTHANAYND
jgi:hypothetical protein